MSEVEETQLRRDLVDHYRKVEALKLNELSSGNLSCRYGNGMLISPTGASAETISEDSVVFVSGDGVWDAGQTPSSEWRMHASIYAEHPAAGAAVHTHSDHRVAVSCHNQPLPGFHYLIGLFGGPDVPCVPYSTFGGEALARDAAAALRERTACLLGNHGMICRAKTLRAAVGLAQRLEIMCRQYVLSRQLGEPSHLTEPQWREFFEQMKAQRYGAVR